MSLCSICLRTNLTVNAVSYTLVSLYDNLLDHQTFPNLSVCATCKQLLERCYNFKQLCLGSNRIFQDWKKKEQNIPIENLHSLIQPYYDKVLDTKDKKTIESEKFDTNNFNSIPNNVDEFEFVENDNNTIEIEDYDDKKEDIIILDEDFIEHNDILKESNELSQLDLPLETKEEINLNLSDDNDNNTIQIKDYDDNKEDIIILDKDFIEHNNILKECSELRQLDLPLETKEEINLNLSDDHDYWRIRDNSSNEHNGIEDKGEKEYKEIKDNSDNGSNRIGDNSDNEYNGIKNNCDIKSNSVYDDSVKNEIVIDDDDDDSDIDNESDDDSIKDLDLINKILEDARKITGEIKKQNQELKKLIKKRKRYKIKPMQNKENYESVFDILVFKNEEEARAELLERPNSDYYKNATYKCTVCYTVFKCQKLLDFHMKWHDVSAGDHVCDICGMRFKRFKTMKYNHKNHVHYGRFSCKKCPLVSYHKSVLVAHSRLHQGYLYKCKHCDKSYRHLQAYQIHLRKSHPSIYHRKNNMCTHCGRTFTSPHGLQVHLSKMHQTTEDVVETDKSVKCEECDLTFANEEAYTVHVMKTPCHKDIAVTLIACPVCGKQFDNRSTLVKHKRQEHPGLFRLLTTTQVPKVKRKFTCKECGAKSGNVAFAWLYYHYKKEHPNIPYKVAKEKEHLCEQCGKSFHVRSQLVSHTREHTGERPFACDVCGRTFASRFRRNIHYEWHKPPSRPCTVCDKKFVSASNLYNHMKTHVGDRRHKCSLCGKGFLHANALNAHVRGVHQQIRRVKKLSRKGKQTQEE